MSAGSGLQSVDFEIFGHVQGVCFRMYTEKEGLRLGLVGWVKNTASGTVVGQVQGPAAMVEEILPSGPAAAAILAPAQQRRRCCVTADHLIEDLPCDPVRSRLEDPVGSELKPGIIN
ncbi:acylphosphatase-2-like isoform X1 [Xiphophorus couchianus]|uniref:acylphosphatase-2-like isoform X1 n=1 Tax=Xiphophorus couchianus TaxID=32473 RepID=UPI001015D3CA|nr:acylphosphatase-2-like isoform X1 [Xiphophorus couchianus]XP_027862898.1 acylphosphatase-2-like isoform X1 [Xiphophorus couchianus]XP_027862899.1 acylphosphatase-2-like isoform X1 [Xiphophorus couchianus]